MTEKSSQTASRPVSPHMQIYKWEVTMLVSFLHRVTGVALAAGTILLVGWLWSAAYSPACFDGIHKFLISDLGQGLLLAWTASFYFHFCNGIRHLFWDVGLGFDIATSKHTAWLVWFASAFFTVCTWAAVQGAISL
jgi:succinate dehydrogenase / fumarate reductase cytochrome b subunit